MLLLITNAKVKAKLWPKIIAWWQTLDGGSITRSGGSDGGIANLFWTIYLISQVFIFLTGNCRLKMIFMQVFGRLRLDFLMHYQFELQKRLKLKWTTLQEFGMFFSENPFPSRHSITKECCSKMSWTTKSIIQTKSKIVFDWRKIEDIKRMLQILLRISFKWTT